MHMVSLFPPFGQMQTQQIRPSPSQPPPQLHQVTLFLGQIYPLYCHFFPLSFLEFVFEKDAL